MAFSFNPGQPAQGGAPNQGAAPLSGIQPAGTPPADALPSVPDSPFLFMRYRDQPMTVNAYLQILLIIVSIFAVAFSIIVFIYSMYLSASINSKREALATRDATFKEYPIDDMKRLSTRFNVLGQILKDYVSVRSPLKLLEDVVEKQAVFNDFKLNKNLANSGYTMSFTVLTSDYRTLIQQLQALNLAQYSKIVPDQKLGTLSDSTNILKVIVTAPVFVQGILADELVFLPPAATGTAQTTPVTPTAPPVTSSTTP